MKGVIRNYFDDKGFGFISGENGDVFFHIKNVMTREVKPCAGMSVEYQEGTNEKGKYAFDVKTSEENGKPLFIILGNDRIKISNIKEYGVADDSDNVLEELGSWEQELKLRNPEHDPFTTETQYNNIKARYMELRNSIKIEKAFKRDLKCLYLTTYQGNTYKYYECECDWNIYEKMKELDSVLC